MRMISDNGLSLYMCRVYWEERVKYDMCSLNIVGGGFSPPPTLDVMVLEGIDIGKSFQTWAVMRSQKEVMINMDTQTVRLLHPLILSTGTRKNILI